MKKRNHSIIAAGLLATTLLTTSPFALADHHGEGNGHRGKHNLAEMCEDFRQGQGRFDQDERRERMEQRRAEMAERLKLTDEQRVIWNDIHKEQREKHEQRHAKMMERLEKRCDRPE